MANEKRLIDANEIEELFYKQVEWGATDLMDAFDDALQDAQTVYAVEVVHGHWLSAYEYAQKLGVTDKEKLEEAKADKWWKFCNHCEQQVKGFHNYCPNCGAKMDGGNEDVNLR